MKISPKNVKFLQEGGAMPAEDPAMAEQSAPAVPEQGGGDPLAQLAEMAMQALQSQDSQLAMQVCEMLVQMLQQAQGGTPASTPEEPVFRKGGKIAYRIKK